MPPERELWVTGYLDIHHSDVPQTALWTTTCIVLSHFSGVRLYNPMDCSPPGSSVHEILQARIMESVPIPSSRGYFQPRDGKLHLLYPLHWQVDSLPSQMAGAIWEALVSL